MLRSWIGAVAVTGLVAAWGGSAAWAQEAEAPGEAAAAGAEEAEEAAEPTDEERERARSAYARGQEAFRAGDYDAAEAAFREAYGAVPNPVVLLGLAEVQERAGETQSAIETLERYLAERQDAPDRAAVEARIERLRQTPATIRFESEPPGAAISIDGENTGDFTPAEVEVPPGEHYYGLAMQGFEPVSETLTLEPGQQVEVERTLTAAAAPEDALGEEGEGVGVEPEPATEEDEATQEDVSTAVWISAGISGAALVGGTVLGFLALSEQSDFDEMPTEDTADRGERLALFADVAFGVAAAAGLTAIVLYLTSDRGDADESPEVAGGIDVSPLVGRDGGGVSARVSF